MKNYWFCEQPAILDEAAKAQCKPHPVFLVVMYWLLSGVLVGWLAVTAVRLFGISPFAMGYEDYKMVLGIFSNVVYLVPFSLIIFFVRFVEKRSWVSMGIVRNKVLKTYLIIVGISLVLCCLFAFLWHEEGQSPLLLIVQLMTMAMKSLCAAMVTYGFLTVSLANRMSIRGTVLVVALLPLIPYVFNVIDVVFLPRIYAPGMEPSLVSMIIESTFRLVKSVILTAVYASLFLRTGHIWGVVILTLFETGIGNLGSTLLCYPYHDIFTIILLVAILYMVLFLPKKNRTSEQPAAA